MTSLVLCVAVCPACGVGNTKPASPPVALVGVWQCNTTVLDKSEEVELGRKLDVVVRLHIRPDGRVSGQVGSAILEQCVYQHNRGPVGRKLNIKTDHIIRGGRIVGPVYDGDLVTKREFTLPFQFEDSRLKGTIMVLGAWEYPNPLTSRLSLERVDVVLPTNASACPEGAAQADTGVAEFDTDRAFTLWDWTAPCQDLALFDAWVADLASLGFTRIEISAPWRELEPEPGVHRTEFIRKRLDVCKQHGLGLRVRLNDCWGGATPGWYDGDFWQDAAGNRVLMGLPSIHDERFWSRFGPLCTEVARVFAGEDIYWSPFIGVHAELKWANWWSFDPSSIAFWRKSITAPRPEWLRAVVPDEVPLPETPPLPPDTAGTPDTNPVHRAVIAFREESWRMALRRFVRAIRAGHANARISVPLGESYRRESALMSNLDYWGLSRGANQVVHSYDFFWHAKDPAWMAGASVSAFRGITRLPVSFELDGPTILTDHGWTLDRLLEAGRSARDAGAGLNVSNWSYTNILPSRQEVVRAFAELWREPVLRREPPSDETVLLLLFKWEFYSFREPDEWLHNARFGTYKHLVDHGVPVRIICEDNLDEDLSGYLALVVAGAPQELMPRQAREKLEKVPLPRTAPP